MIASLSRIMAFAASGTMLGFVLARYRLDRFDLNELL